MRTKTANTSPAHTSSGTPEAACVGAVAIAVLVPVTSAPAPPRFRRPDATGAAFWSALSCDLRLSFSWRTMRSFSESLVVALRERSRAALVGEPAAATSAAESEGISRPVEVVPELLSAWEEPTAVAPAPRAPAPRAPAPMAAAFDEPCDGVDGRSLLPPLSVPNCFETGEPAASVSA